MIRLHRTKHKCPAKDTRRRLKWLTAKRPIRSRKPLACSPNFPRPNSTKPLTSRSASAWIRSSPTRWFAARFRFRTAAARLVRVLVFAKGNAADAAKAAGAENVGFEDMIAKCNGGWTDFDVAIATPEAMVEVRKLGKVLGPRGLMPNPKTGTVTEDTAKAVKEVKAGRVEFKVDKAANVHVIVGKASFKPEQIEENARAVIEAVAKARPNSVKGTYINSCTLSATMSPPVRVDVREFATN